MPDLIQYLAGLPICDRVLVQRRGARIEIPYLAAGATLRRTLAPASTEHAILVLRVAFGDVLPDSFNANISVASSVLWSDRLSADLIREGFDCFLAATTGYPLTVELTNRDSIALDFECEVQYLAVPSVQNLNLLDSVLRQGAFGIATRELLAELLNRQGNGVCSPCTPVAAMGQPGDFSQPSPYVSPDSQLPAGYLPSGARYP